MKTVILFFLVIPICVVSQSKKDKFDLDMSVITISPDLKKDAHTVYRLDEGIVDVTAPGRYTFKIRQILTILNKDGAHHLYQSLGIDKFRKIDEVEIKVFNQLGIETEKYKKKDFSVTAAYDGMSLITDSRVMRLHVQVSEYPVTLEIKYTVEVTSYINLPSWYFQSPAEAVELSRFIVKVPTDIDIRYRAKHINIHPVITTEGSKKNYLWEVKNLLAKKGEEGAGGYAKNPRLLVGANQFEYDGHRGSMTDWKNIGLWYNGLVKQTNQLSEKYKSEIQSLVSGASNDVEKIKILYSHLQNNFRYVSIQLGIGGFRPFPADFVHEKKYGDCKALSNYMEACLSAINIKAYSAWINAGPERSPVDPDFPYDGFNHQILCVPLNKDTVWLECTSKTVDFAHLGNFTENRNALVMTDNGGILVATPVSKSNQNCFTVATTVNIDETGGGKIESIMRTTGEYKYEQIAYSHEKDDIKKNYFINHLGFPNPDEFEVVFGEKSMQPLTSSVKMTLQKLNDFSAGNKMFLKSRFCKIWTQKLPSAELRTEDYLFECPLQKTDTTVLKLPSGYVSDALPKTKDIKCDFATYQTKYWYDENQKAIYSTAKLELNQRLIPADKYASVKSFFDEVIKDDAQRIIIKKE
jgi:hypothetical protein